MVHKISGKYSSTKIHHLDVNGDEVTDIPDIANSLAQSFSQNSSYSGVPKSLIHTGARLKIID